MSETTQRVIRASRQNRVITPEIEAAARERCGDIARVFAKRAFYGRRGHGGGVCMRRSLTPEQLAELMREVALVGFYFGVRVPRAEGVKIPAAEVQR